MCGKGMMWVRLAAYIRFTVKDGQVDGRTPPKIALELQDGEAPGLVLLYLRPGYTDEDARDIAHRLNEMIDVVTFCA